MTEDLSVQQRSSALPIAAGMIIGGTGGYFVDKIPGFYGVPKAKYSSFEDIMNEKKDFFTKTENMTEKQKEAAGKIQTERDKVTQYIKENAKNAKYDEKLKAEAETVAAKQSELKTAYNNALEGVKKQIASKDIPIENLDVTKEADVTQAAKKYLKEHLDDDAYKAVKDARDGCKSAREALVQKAKSENVSSQKVIEGLKEKMTSAWETVSKDASKFKAPRKLLNIGIGAAVFGVLAALLFKPRHKDEY